MKVQSVLAMALGLGMTLGACGSGSTQSGTGGSTSNSGGSTSSSGGSAGNGSGGASSKGGTTSSSGGASAGGASGSSSGGTAGGSSGGAAGGSGGAGGGASCSNVTACGGDVTGTWTVTGSCLKISGTLDLTNLGIGCKSADVTGTLQVTGTWTGTAGAYTDKTSTTGTEQVSLGPSCLTISGTTTTCDAIGGVIGSVMGFDSFTCKNAASGGGCTCDGTVKQDGLPGVVSMDASASGNYTTASNAVTIDNSTQYSYCVSGNTMTWTPKTTTPTTTGTIVLQKGTVGGTGGTSGSGGKAAGGSSGSGGTGAGGIGSGGSSAGGSGGGTSPQGPCDIYGAANVPCVAAFSTTRVLYSKYTGPLYQVRKGGGSKNTGTGGTTQDIGSKDGFADSSAQDAFCGTDTCTFSVIYDQSGKKNDLKVAPAGCYTGTASEADYESSATHSLTISGHKVYSLYMNPHEGYRNNKTNGVPVGDVGQGIYEVADGKRLGAACCFDFGNAAPNNCNGGTMTALFFGTGYWGKGAGSGPWFLADLEAGVWAGGTGASNAVNSKNPSMAVPYAFGVLKSGPGNYAILAADATTGSLTSAYDGAQPKKLMNQGAIVLGIGGDNSNSSLGTFFEGVITNGRPTDDTDTAVLKNVQAAGYGK